jgi:MFS transporter, ENTS family, enterobactin (siderophore) exporter
VIPDSAIDIDTPADLLADRRHEPLGQNRDFKILLAGQGMSAIGDAVSFTAMPLLILALTGSGLAMGVVGVLQAIPDLIFGMVAGVFADRNDRRRMMLLADLGRAGLTALIPLSFVFGVSTIAVVFLVAAPMTILRSFFMAAYTSSLPNLVGRPQLGRANSIFEVIYSFGYIIGPGIAGLLVATIGAAETIAIDAASYALSAVALFFIRRPLTLVRDHPPLELLREIREGAAFVFGHRPLRDAVAFWGVVTAISAGTVPALAYFVIKEETLDAAALGLILGAYGLGSFGGAVVTTRLRLHRAGRLMLVGNAVRGIALIALVATGTLPAMMVAAVAFGFVESLVLITYITLRAASSPDELLGRVGGTSRTVSLGLSSIGFVVAGLLIDAVGGEVTLAAIGLAMLAMSGLFVWSRPLRQADAQTR